MSLGDKLQLARLIALLLRPGEDSSPDARVAEERLAAPGGARFDSYRPRGPARAAVVVAHGGDYAGSRNGRLVRFARALARCGVACAVPELAGLARSTFDAGDLDELEAVCHELRRATGERPGIVGFAYGGGYALTAAARDSLAGELRFVVTIGAFHDLPALFDWYLERDRVEPRGAAEWDDAIYLRLIMGYWFRSQLGLPEDLVREMESLLRRFCDEASEAEKRAFYERHLRAQDVFAVAKRSLDRDLLARLSPSACAGRVRCPVTLVHDRFDGTVPPRDAERLHQAIPGSKLVRTEVLAHVTPARALDLVSLARLTVALGPVVASPPAPLRLRGEG